MTSSARNARRWLAYWLFTAFFIWLIAFSPAAMAQGLVRLGDPESGALLLKTQTPGEYAEAPLVAADVAIDVTGPIVRARVTQRFENPSDQWVEGIYVFPLPDDSGVDRLRMQIGDRFIEGRIEERAEARRIYEEAREAGQRAGLIEQERPNMFTASVANIGPGETVVVQIEYQDTARLKDGAWSLRLPLVVGPRYIPRPTAFIGVGHDGNPAIAVADPVPDSGRVTPPVLHPDDEPDGRLRLPVSISVDLRPGFALGEVTSPYHDIAVAEGDSGRTAEISLGRGAIPANRDFVLEWRAADLSAPLAALFREARAGETYYLGVIAPPARRPVEPPAREVIFVIDNSGSMAGESIRQARKALAFALDRLDPRDSFNIVRFDDSWEQIFAAPLPATEESVGFAQRFVAGLEAEGGTEMLPALKAALYDDDPDDGRLRQVVFLTDGAIGNEDQLFAAIKAGLGQSRLFTVGIGSAPNSYFMNRAARFGRGTFLHIGDVEEVAEKTSSLLAALESPALTDLEVDSGGALTAVWPSPLPDLYAGEPVMFTAKAAGDGGGLVVASGRFRGRAWAETLDLGEAVPGAGVANLWARDRIAAIEELRFERGVDYDAIDAAVLETALEFGLVSRLTSLVAVDVTPARPEGAPLESAEIATMLPEGWEFDRVFGPAIDAARPLYRADAGAPQFAALEAQPEPGSPEAAEAAAATGGLPLPQGALLLPLRIGLGAGLLLLAALVLLAGRRRWA